MTSSPAWRVARVDRTCVRLVAADPETGAPRTGPAAGPVVRLRPGGVLDAVVGEPVAPAVGDAVVPAPTDADPDRFLLAPRRSELVRDSVDRTAGTQVLAANVDVVLVVEHLDPEPKLGRIERLVTLAWRSGATPVVVLTKADLVTDAPQWLDDVARVAPGVGAHAVSAATGEGLDAVRAVLEPGTTLVVVGPSGAGKSTLVNALAGGDVMATGQRRESDGRGRHTTTHRELVPAGECWLIDTPGLRAVGLVADADAVDETFPEVAELAAQCRFGDCAHAGEPGCAIAAAIEDGRLDERRLASWRTQQREVAHQARRAGDRAAQLDFRRSVRQRERDIRTYHRVTGRGGRP
ncbi:ribosome biogenesis GTPase [Salana multivorans]|uniref:Small ribosomal subunit biogenesis GTPase RsgA n=1 Tax=Salana multivorans TaxID=120377 RepID=A0A3N2DBH8_9MICO|nr:ribosome small subunit-dependent GTPase A [Salana multivorans]ROR97116.1 ribosome biogenesis GTPase [Salana multivorans]